MDGKRDENDLFELTKSKSQDSGLGFGRRRGSSVSSSFGSSWFKKLSHKMSGAETDANPQRRKSSVGSLFSSSSQESERQGSPEPAQVSRTYSFKEGFRRRNHSIPAIPSAPSPSQISPTMAIAPKETFATSSPTASASSSLVPGSPSRSNSSSLSTPATLADLRSRKISTRAVGFALSTFEDNPPQKIPPVAPVEGNIEFLDTGEVVVHKRAKSYYGIDTQPHTEKNHSEVVRLAQLKARQNAERLHTSITSNPLTSLFHSGVKAGANASKTLLEDDDEIANTLIAGKDVDGTAHAKNLRFKDSSQSDLVADEEQWDMKANAMPSPPPDQIYTRCCHLREIMPIRNILRQLQGQLAPIPRVRVANTRPTLVEIQAFSDFLTVVPVSSLILDNHILTDEMIRLILVGILRSRDIARLTFVNTRMGPLGWQYLCSFLANCNKSLLAINLSCTTPSGVPHRVPSFTREDMDWRLLSDALKEMGTLEELDVGGTMIKIEDLKYLIEQGFKQGRILGLANNNLGHDDVKFVADWAQKPESQLMGINLGGNDLSREEDWSIVQEFLRNPRIYQLSLRNSKLSHMHASHLIQAISPSQARKSNLRQLDLSYNPELFPYLIDLLAAALPNFQYLSRLQMDHCNLTSDTIVTLCEAISHCHRLVYLSVLGNCKLNESAATALCVAVHLSRSICTVEADIDESNVALRQQLATYCIQNLEKNAGSLAQQLPAEEDDTADISSFHEDLRAVTKAFSAVPEGERLPEQKYKVLVERMEGLRLKIKLRMHALLIKRRTGPLVQRDRESLMRLFFYSNNLDRLKREVRGCEAVQETQQAEEIVKNVGEEDIQPPSLNRASSQLSLLSLKKLEREEGESHKAYSEKIMDLDDDGILHAAGKLKLRDLEQIMS